MVFKKSILLAAFLVSSYSNTWAAYNTFLQECITLNSLAGTLKAKKTLYETTWRQCVNGIGELKAIETGKKAHEIEREIAIATTQFEDTARSVENQIVTAEGLDPLSRGALIGIIIACYGQAITDVAAEIKSYEAISSLSQDRRSHFLLKINLIAQLAFDETEAKTSNKIDDLRHKVKLMKNRITQLQCHLFRP